ncbi:septum formation initiator family protein [Clostridiales bacterium COT073_COT-073]|nr:septum formation initiator family protein [Clostridiales bacterium COT073_COT-073]
MEKERDKRSRLYILFVVCILVAAVTFQLVGVFREYNEKQGEIEALQQKIKEENEKNLRLKEHEKYMKSDAYIEEKAREEFNLIKDGEEIYILKKE